MEVGLARDSEGGAQDDAAVSEVVDADLGHRLMGDAVAGGEGAASRAMPMRLSTMRLFRELTMTLPTTCLLGTVMRSPSSVISTVAPSFTSSTMPEVDFTVMVSPTVMGRPRMMAKPAPKFDSGAGQGNQRCDGNAEVAQGNDDEEADEHHFDPGAHEFGQGLVDLLGQRELGDPVPVPGRDLEADDEKHQRADNLKP